MSRDERLEGMIQEWQERIARQETVSLADLCRHTPELLPELEQRVTLLTNLQRLSAEQTTDAPKDPRETVPLGSREVSASAAPPGYEILGELGRGGMGVVYKARHLKLDRLVALKMILSGPHASRAQLERFLVEARAIARFQHPNIVQIFDVGEHEGLPYCALEFVEGGSLDAVVRGRQQDARTAAAWAEQVARAMHYAHQRQVVHRDLKPANILQSRDGILKVTDFGLAKQLDGDVGQTQSGAVLGTPAYMAPEQAAGQIDRIGPTTDVYAIGAMLYEFLTGRPPFQAASLVETLDLVRNGEPTPPRALNPGVPRDLETICLKCLSREPVRRYASALALAQDLERFQAGEPILGRREGVVRRLGRRLRRRAGLVVSVLLVVVAVGVAGYGMMAAGSTQKLAGLQTAFARDLEACDWSFASLASLEETADAIAALDPRQGASAREQLIHRRAEAIRNQIVTAPRLWGDRVRELEEAIAWLSDRDEDSASSLRDELRKRQTRTTTLFDLAAPFEDRQVIFGTRALKIEGSTLNLAENTHGVVLTEVPCQNQATLDVEFAPNWMEAREIGLVLNASEGHPSGVHCLLVSADRSTLLSTSWNSPVRVWDLSKGRERSRLTISLPGAIALHPLRQVVALGVNDTVELRNLSDATLERTFPILGGVHQIACSADGTRLAASNDNGVKVWDLASGAEQTYSLGGQPLQMLRFGGTRLVGIDKSRRMLVWDLQAPSKPPTISAPLEGMTDPHWFPGADVHPSGRYCWAGGSQIHLGNSPDEAARRVVRIPGVNFSHPAFSPDGQRIAVFLGEWCNVYRIGREEATLETRFLAGSTSNYPYCLSFIDAQTLAVGLAGGTIRIFDLRTGLERRTLGAEGYRFVLRAGKSFREASASPAGVTLAILRNGTTLRSRVEPIRPGPLHLSVRRAGARLEVRVNQGEPLVFNDPLPLGSTDRRFGLVWPGEAGLIRLRATGQTVAREPGPMDRADTLFEEQQFADALALYRAHADDRDLGVEARCKSALCLVQLRRPDEAAPLLEAVTSSPGDRWPLVAACHLWLLRLKQNRPEDVEAVMAIITGRFSSDSLAEFVPLDTREAVVRNLRLDLGDYLSPDPQRVRRLQQAVQAGDLLDAGGQSRLYTRYHLSRALSLTGTQDRAALEVARQALDLSLTAQNEDLWALIWNFRWWSWLAQTQGKSTEALQEADRLVKRYGSERPLLRLDRARLLAAAGRTDESLIELGNLLAIDPPPGDYRFHAATCLLRGVLLEGKGDSKGAMEVWKTGLYRAYVARLPVEQRMGHADSPTPEFLVYHLILASLTDSLPDADGEGIIRTLVSRLGGAGPLVNQVMSTLRLTPETLRTMWRTKRGHDLARRMAMGTVPPSEFYRAPMMLIVYEKIRSDAFAGPISEAQDAVAWDVVREGGSLYYQGKLSQAQLLQLGLTWKGTTNFLGWGGVSRSLPPAFRATAAYVFAQRLLRLNKPAEARRLLDTASKDAAEGSPVRSLAEASVQALPK